MVWQYEISSRFMHVWVSVLARTISWFPGTLLPLFWFSNYSWHFLLQFCHEIEKSGPNSSFVSWSSRLNLVPLITANQTVILIRLHSVALWPIPVVMYRFGMIETHSLKAYRLSIGFPIIFFSTSLLAFKRVRKNSCLVIETGLRAVISILVSFPRFVPIQTVLFTWLEVYVSSCPCIQTDCCIKHDFWARSVLLFATVQHIPVQTFDCQKGFGRLNEC